MKLQMIGAGLVVLALSIATSAQEQQSSASIGGETSPFSVTCTYNIGGFACVSTTGNLASFKNMAGAELLNAAAEAYGLCDAGGNRWMWAFAESGFGAPVTIKSSGTAVTIEQLTTDGAFKLTHAWKADKKERDLTVTNTITNMSGVPRTGVKFIRTGHHTNVTSTAAFDRGSNSAWLRWVLPSVAITATAMPPNNATSHSAEISGSGINTACDPAGPLATPGTCRPRRWRVRTDSAPDRQHGRRQEGECRHGVPPAVSHHAYKTKSPRLFRISGFAVRLINPRQRPTLPRTYARSTIGGSRLNFRVRNGNGCDPAPMTTGKLLRIWRIER